MVTLLMNTTAGDSSVFENDDMLTPIFGGGAVTAMASMGDEDEDELGDGDSFGEEDDFEDDEVAEDDEFLDDEDEAFGDTDDDVEEDEDEDDDEL